MTLSSTPPKGKPPTPNNSPVRASICVSRKPSYGKRFQVTVLSEKGGSTEQIYFSRGTSKFDLSMLPFGKISHVAVTEIKRSDIGQATSSSKGVSLINIKFEPPAEHHTVLSCKFEFANNKLTLDQKEGSEKLIMRKIIIPEVTKARKSSQLVFERTITYKVGPAPIE